MKRILFILAVVLTATTVYGQRFPYTNTAHHVVSGGYITEYQAVYDAMTTPPGSDTAAYQDTLVRTLVTAGIWSGMKIFYGFATNNEDNALINWSDPGTYDLTNSSTVFTYMEGFSGNGTSQYLSNGWNPNDDSSGIGSNNISLGAYIKENPTTSGYIFASNPGQFDLNLVSGSTYFSTRLFSESSISASLLEDGRGFILATRRSDSVEVYHDTYSVSTTYQVRGDILSMDNDVFRRNQGTPDGYYDGEAGIIFVSDSLTDEDYVVIRDAFNEYFHNIGTSVFSLNVISNGDFSTTDDWTTNGDWSITDNTLYYTDGSSSFADQAAVDMNINMEVNSSYWMEFDLVTTGTAGLSYYNAAHTQNYTADTPTNGHNRLLLTTGSDVDGGGFTFRASGSGTTADFSINNLIIRKIQ